jgi:hypothetical protein
MALRCLLRAFNEIEGSRGHPVHPVHPCHNNFCLTLPATPHPHRLIAAQWRRELRQKATWMHGINRISEPQRPAARSGTPRRCGDFTTFNAIEGSRGHPVHPVHPYHNNFRQTLPATPHPHGLYPGSLAKGTKAKGNMDGRDKQDIGTSEAGSKEGDSTALRCFSTFNVEGSRGHPVHPVHPCYKSPRDLFSSSPLPDVTCHSTHR